MKQASVLLKQGQLGEAQQLCEQICSADPGNAECWMQLGAINGMQNNHSKAADCFKTVLGLRPDSVAARINYAQALLQSGEHEKATEQLEHVLRSNPGSEAAWCMLGRCRAESDQLEVAIEAYHRVLVLNPDHAQASHGLGFALHRLGRWEESVGHFRHALHINPRLAQAHFGLGFSLQKMGNQQEAHDHLQQAVVLNPEYAEAHLAIGTALSMMGKQHLAVTSIQEAIRLKPDFTDARITLAATLMPLGQPDEALHLLEHVIHEEPGNIEAIALATIIDQHKGDIESARKRLKPLIGTGENHANIALAYAAICNSIDEPDSAIDMMEQLLEKNESLTAAGRRNLHFNLGRLYDKKNAYSKAFEHYQRGNALKEAEFDPEKHTNYIRNIITIHSEELMASMPRSCIRSERPIFVVGMPRSGTSLVEQILSSHPEVFGAGELPHIIQLAGSLQTTQGDDCGYPECIPVQTQQQLDKAAQYYLDKIADLSPDAVRVIDKMPGNFMFLGYIELLFPDARIVHCKRDPLDTCLSCYFQNFTRSQQFSYDLTNLGIFYKNYAELMQHWLRVIKLPVLEVQYEDMIDNQEKYSKHLVEFCGLNWDERCLNFHETQRYVATASFDQVRRPIYNSSVYRWKNYAEYIEPLRGALE